MTKRNPRLTDYVAAGAADWQERTPWKRAPIAFETWLATGVETDEQRAYWSGWEAGAIDALAKVQREMQQR